MTYTYKVLDIPQVPDYLVKQALEIVAEDSKKKDIANWHGLPGYSEYRHRKVQHLNGHVFITVGTTRYRVSEEFEEWVRENFSGTKTTLCGVSVMDVNHSKTMAPHVDTSRNYTIQYLLDTGGSNVETVWWKEHGKPVVRPDLRQNYDPSSTIQDYSNLVEIDRIKAEPNVWISLHSAILHSIENLETPRIAFQVGADIEPSNLPWTYISTINT
jgi:hypothetical protein